MKKIIVAATFAVIAATSVASAADLAVKAPVYKAPAAVVSDWTGFYIGVNGGYGWGRSNDWSIPPLGAGFGIGPIGTGATGGGLFGGQIGYNWQIKSWVIGVQGDGDWSNIKGNATNTASPDGRCWSGGDQTSDCRTNYKAMGNLTAKLGYLFLPTTLIYGKAGVNFASLDLQVNNITDITGGTCAPVGSHSPGYNANSSTQTKFTAGAGVEQRVSDRVSIFGEYDYVDGGGSSTNLNTGGTGAAGCTPNFTTTTTLKPLNIVKFGLNYTFGGPIVAKY
jgi:outer membrane immunogenic protein